MKINFAANFVQHTNIFHQIYQINKYIKLNQIKYIKYIKLINILNYFHIIFTVKCGEYYSHNVFGLYVVAEAGGMFYSHRFMAHMAMGSHGEPFTTARSLNF